MAIEPKGSSHRLTERALSRRRADEEDALVVLRDLAESRPADPATTPFDTMESLQQRGLSVSEKGARRLLNILVVEGRATIPRRGHYALDADGDLRIQENRSNAKNFAIQREGTSAMATEKEVFKETYRKGARRVSAHLLPERLPCMSRGFRVVGMEVRAAGKMSDGREFQDIRVYVAEADEPREEGVASAED